MPATIRFAASAVSDLEDLQAWYAEQGVAGTGTRLIADVVQRIEHLADHPDMGRVVPGDRTTHPAARTVPPGQCTTGTRSLPQRRRLA